MAEDPAELGIGIAPPTYEMLQEALRKKRELTARWHATAVSLGFEGVDHALHELQVLIRRQRMRTSTVGAPHE
jgi:hypothetical protein